MTLPSFALLLMISLPALNGFASTLAVGDIPPPLTNLAWLEGKPVPTFEPGQIYVVDFWATWCPPCLGALPDLEALQQKFSARGVRFLGIAARERGEAHEQSLKIRHVSNSLSYPIAYDPSPRTAESWLEASGAPGLPTVFIIDRATRIAFIGNPNKEALEDTLNQILEGRWESSGNQHQHAVAWVKTTERSQIVQRVRRLLHKAEHRGDAARALKIVRSGLRLIPDEPNFMSWEIKLLWTLNRTDEGFATLERHSVAFILNRDAQYMLLGTLFDPFGMDRELYATLPAGKRLQHGRPLAGRLEDLLPESAGEAEFGMHLLLAQYRFEIGDQREAIRLVETAIKAIEHSKHRKLLARTGYRLLANVSAKEVCDGDVCYPPERNYALDCGALLRQVDSGQAVGQFDAVTESEVRSAR